MTRPTHAIPGLVLGYTRTGRAIHPIAGGAPGRARDLPPDPAALAEALAARPPPQLRGHPQRHSSMPP